jgi:uncharacterized cupredoxin-like copper-binding protein
LYPFFDLTELKPVRKAADHQEMLRSSQGRLGRRLLLGLAPLAVIVAVVVAAFWGGSRAGAAASGLPVLKVSESDFRIKAPKVVRAGELLLRTKNLGPDTHELLVVRFAGKRLPLRADDMTVDEEALESATALTVEGFERGRSREARIHLAPGRYVLLCNMQGHYLGGMHATVTVR